MDRAAPIGAGKLEGRRGRGSGAAKRPPIRTPERWEFDVLRLLAEQAAVPFDQLARFLGCEPEQAARVARHLTKAGYADYGRTLTYEPHWAWLTTRGARFSGMEFPAKPPKVGAMARMRAVNEVRLHIATRAPQARWVCARSIVREQGKRGYRPNAIVEVGRERHALLVKLGFQSLERERDILETQMARHDAVVVFCAPSPEKQLERLAAEHRWPKLVVRPMPKPQSQGCRPA